MRRMTDKYHLLKSFCSVVDHQSFAKAASEMGSTTSSISKNVRQLENEIGQSLLFRTTRSMALTDAGEIYYKRGKQLLKNWQELESELTNLNKTPSGRLCITLPVAIGQQLLSPIITDFMNVYPNIVIELKFTHKTMELIDDDVDIAIRTWKVFPQAPLYKTDLTQLQPTLVASPAYIEKYGSPLNIKDLNNHKLLIFNKGMKNENKWHFPQHSIVIKGHLYSNDHLNLLEAAQNGIGIANVYSCLCQKELDSGKLVEVLPEHTQSPTNLSAVYRQQRTTSTKLHCFLEFLENALRS